MDQESVGDDWVELWRFEDGRLAHDVTTAVLAMEFEAMLVDLSTDSILLGVGSHADEGSPQASGPFVLNPSGRLPLNPGALIGHGGIEPNQDYVSTESRDDTERRRTQGGPWSLLVRSGSCDDLELVIEELVEEQLAFEAKVVRKAEDRRRFNLTIGSVVVVLLLGYLAFLLLRFMGILN